MNKGILLIAVLTWCGVLAVLIIALTDIWPGNSFADYRIPIGIGFLVITGFLRTAFRRTFLLNKPD